VNIETVLRDTFGFASFRPAQREVIDLIMEGRNVLAVMPTGSGKSLCYQLPALARDGLTLVVSPLIALMKDQIDHLERLGAPASVINSTVPRDVQHSRIERAIRGDLKMLYVAPERFQNEGFRAGIRKARVGMFAIDEAHCVSMWGHDFRPDYLRLRNVIAELGRPQTVALTATATPAVREDIVKQLDMTGALQVVSGFDRPNLFLEVREPSTVAEKVRAIIELCEWAPTGIVYAGTRRNVEDIHRALTRRGLPALAYHAGLSMEERKSVQNRFMKQEAGIIVATNAFGMGIDRADVRFVVHADIPDSLEAYYQEIGRAGRDGQPARCLLLFNYADKWIPENFIDSSHPSPAYLKEAFGRLLATGSPLVVAEKWKKASGRADPRFHAAVSLLDRAGFVQRVNTAEGRGVRILRSADRNLTGFNFDELERRREFELRKFGVMLQYASRFRRHCYRSFVLRYFGEWTRMKDCGACSRCAPDAHPRRTPRRESAPEVVSSAPVRPAKPVASAGDSVTVALKILSCILRVQEQLGREKVAKILAGSSDSSIEEFRKLSTYGLLSDYSIPTIVSMIDHLIIEGFIERGEGHRPTIHVSQSGRVFLKERPPITIPGV
jgi:ATP-dependent DNA helicase RecQ